MRVAKEMNHKMLVETVEEFSNVFETISLQFNAKETPNFPLPSDRRLLFKKALRRETDHPGVKNKHSKKEKNKDTEKILGKKPCLSLRKMAPVLPPNNATDLSADM